jgi:hypothetical protein
MANKKGNKKSMMVPGSKRPDLSMMDDMPFMDIPEPKKGKKKGGKKK